MDGDAGLRARKKERTRRAIADTAIGMFLEHGFDAVSTADIAAAVEVSRPTLFRYFATKEDLVVHRFVDHIGEPARVVRERDPALTPLTALHRHLRDGLDRRDPVTGLSDHPNVIAFHGLVFDTPSLAARVAGLGAADTDALAAALLDSGADGGPDSGRDSGRDGGTGAGPATRSRLLATQVIVVRQALARANWAEIVAGRSADEVYPQALAAADDAFALLGRGAAGFGY